MREDEVTRPDGQPGLYGVVEVRSPAVFVVPVTAAGEVVLIEVDRYATGGPSWEVPAGGSDGQDLLVAARRELLEEAGLVAGELRALARVQSLNGVADAPGQVFLARDLHAAEGAEREVEGITAQHSVSLPELVGMISRGEISDNETLGALLVALVELGRVS